MKPYRETHTLKGVLNAPIETVWALRTNPEEMCSIFSRIFSMEVVSGRPGEKGCLMRSTMRMTNGRKRKVDIEVTEVHPPRSITMRLVLPGKSSVTNESTRMFTRQGNHTPTTLVASVQTKPVPGLTRFLMRLSRARRARQVAIQFQTELAEENAYYARMNP